MTSPTSLAQKIDNGWWAQRSTSKCRLSRVTSSSTIRENSNTDAMSRITTAVENLFKIGTPVDELIQQYVKTIPLAEVSFFYGGAAKHFLLEDLCKLITPITGPFDTGREPNMPEVNYAARTLTSPASIFHSFARIVPMNHALLALRKRYWYELIETAATAGIYKNETGKQGLPFVQKMKNFLSEYLPIILSYSTLKLPPSEKESRDRFLSTWINSLSYEDPIVSRVKFSLCDRRDE